MQNKPLPLKGGGPTSAAMTDSELKAQLKQMLVDELMLQVSPAEIGDDTPLFGPGGLGLDSVDALQLAVALEKHHGLKLVDGKAAQSALRCVDTIAAAIQEQA